MARFDRYLLSQLMVLFGFFALVLVLVYWINRAVVLFDQLIADGQSAVVFLEFTALTLPNVIRAVLPVAVFASSVYVTNRLSSESELVVVQSTGFSAFRLARPILVFGILVGMLMALLTHFLVPASISRLSIRSAEIAENVTSRLLTEGTFLHPSDGVTFYLREISDDGELRDIFLSDARTPDQTTTYTAKSALLIREDTGPKLVMFDGLAQILQADGRLFTTRFDDFAYDLGALIKTVAPIETSVRALPTTALFEPRFKTRFGEGNTTYEFHRRIAQPLLALVAGLIGFSALMVGGFSRFGIWRQILGAVVILILVKIIESSVADLTRRLPTLWPLIYLPALFGLFVSGCLLWISERPSLWRSLTDRVKAVAP